MEIRKPEDRRRLRQRLMQGAQQARRREALLAIPAITTALAKIRSDKADARTRFQALCDGTGDSQASAPAVNPLIREKARTYSLWATLILIVEVALATYAGSLTVAGGWLLHIGVGIMATILFCGLANLTVASNIDVGHTEDSIRRLERQLHRVAIGTVIALAGFFVARFFPFAELVFALTSTALSFAVAFIVAICHTLAQLLGAAGQEVNRFTDLSLLEAELAGLLKLAEDTAKDTPTASCGERCKLGTLGTVMGLLLMLLLPVTADAAEVRLNIWVDVSGSLAAEEFDRVRTILGTPLALLERLPAREISLTLFWSEETALFGASGVWRLPELAAPPACDDDASVFTATRRARESACAAARAEVTDKLAGESDKALAPYRTSLAGIDVSVDRTQTCLFPVLNRVAASGGFHLVVTDGAHANCGPPPPAPVAVDTRAAVILIPDNAGTGLAARMGERTEQLARLYPGLAILPSWKVDGIAALVAALTGGE